MTLRAPTNAAPSSRAYDALVEHLRGAHAVTNANATRESRLQAFCDALWPALAPTGVSWLGFYTAREGDAEMILAARRDKPACSPIGMHGACGRCFLSKQPLVVRDVKDLGTNYVACDPRDASEVVVPCFDADGAAWGVLDLDSWDVGSFTEEDAQWLTRCLIAAGLSA